MEGLLLKLSLLVVTLCVLHVYGNDEEDEYNRALRAFHLLQREPQWEEERSLERRSCKARGEGCQGLPKCCGADHCYWADGFVPFTDGVCVKCVEQDQKCQSNDQCCAGLQCDRDNPFWVDGRCAEPRITGNCYQESQCKFDCKHIWWPPAWVCVG